MSKKEGSPNQSNEDLYDKDAFDHIRKKVDSKNTKTTTASAGISTSMKVFFLGIIIFSGLLFSGVLTGVDSPFGTFGDNPDNQNNGNQVDNPLTTMCVNHGELSLHDHYYLKIYIDGGQQVVPANIGIPSSSCYRPTHTHDSSGKVHVELPTDYTGDVPNLGTFFEIWGESLGNNTLMGSSGEVSLFVNGNQDTREDPGSLIPPDEANVELRITTS